MAPLPPLPPPDATILVSAIVTLAWEVVNEDVPAITRCPPVWSIEPPEEVANRLVAAIEPLGCEIVEAAVTCSAPLREMLPVKVAVDPVFNTRAVVAKLLFAAKSPNVRAPASVAPIDTAAPRIRLRSASLRADRWLPRHPG